MRASRRRMMKGDVHAQVLERLQRRLPGHEVFPRGRRAPAPDAHHEGGVQSAEQVLVEAAPLLRAAELVVRSALPLRELAVDGHPVHHDAEVSETACCQACCSTRGVRDDDAVCGGVERGRVRVVLVELDVRIRSVLFTVMGSSLFFCIFRMAVS
jgi:hypothetical protein